MYFLTLNIAFSAEFQNGSFEQNDALWNPDFMGFIDYLTDTEQDLTSWNIQTLEGSGGLEWVKASTVTDGIYTLHLVGSPARHRISQIFDSYAGKPYQVNYYIYGRSNATAIQNQVLVTLKNQNSAGTVLFTRTENPAATDSWVKYSFTFTPTSNRTYISFENTVSSTVGSHLDNIHVDMLSNFQTNTNTYVYDPFQQNLKSIPGQDMAFSVSLKSLAGRADTDTLDLKFKMPPELIYKLNSFTFIDSEIVGTGKFTPENDGIPVASTGLSCCTSAQMTYSSDGINFDYTPSAAFYNDFGEGYDPNVRAIRIKPTGVMNHGTPNPVGFRIYYLAQIK